jgi:hypothetical protein
MPKKEISYKELIKRGFVPYDDVYSNNIKRGLTPKDARKLSKSYVENFTNSVMEEEEEINDELNKINNYLIRLSKDYKFNKKIPIIIKYLTKKINE